MTRTQNPKMALSRSFSVEIKPIDSNVKVRKANDSQITKAFKIQLVKSGNHFQESSICYDPRRPFHHFLRRTTMEAFK